MALTPAEKQRRYRERQRNAALMIEVAKTIDMRLVDPGPALDEIDRLHLAGKVSNGARGILRKLLGA